MLPFIREHLALENLEEDVRKILVDGGMNPGTSYFSKKISAIKHVREAKKDAGFDYGLREAKEYVELIEDKLRMSSEKILDTVPWWGINE
jgi:hypothetical protein